MYQSVGQKGLMPALGTRILGIMVSALGFFRAESVLAGDNYQEHLSKIGLAESAASLGSLGMRVSAGVTQLPEPKGDIFQTGQRGLKAKESPYVQRIWFSKGLMIPVNVGLALSQLSELGWLDVTSHVQWTVFEGLGTPAIALRSSFGRSFGMERAQVSTAGADIGISYGFLKYFAFFGALGIKRQETSLFISDEGLKDQKASPQLAEETTTRLLPSGELGFQMTLYPGIAAFTWASLFSEGAISYHTAKVTLAI